MRWLGFDLGRSPLYASDYFDQLYDWAEELIDQGQAYVDDQDAETISAAAGRLRPSPASTARTATGRSRRTSTCSRRMRAGEFADGDAGAARQDRHGSPQHEAARPGAVPHPHAPHHVAPATTGASTRRTTGPTASPTPSRASPTRSARSSSTSHRPLYDWFLDHLDLPARPPEQIEFARLEPDLHRACRKRKLLQLVERGRTSTAGTTPACRPCAGCAGAATRPRRSAPSCDHIGVAKTNSTVEIELLESFVRDDLNRTALRRMAVLRPLKVVIDELARAARSSMLEAVNNPEDAVGRHPPGAVLAASSGSSRTTSWRTRRRKYFRLAPGPRGAAALRLLHHLHRRGHGRRRARSSSCAAPTTPRPRGGNAPDGRKVKATIHWVSAAHAVDAEVRLYDHLFTDAHPGADGADPLDGLNPTSLETLTGAKLEPALAEAAPGQVGAVRAARLLRRRPRRRRTLFHRTVGLRDEWANIQKRNQNQAQQKQQAKQRKNRS